MPAGDGMDHRPAKPDHAELEQAHLTRRAPRICGREGRTRRSCRVVGMRVRGDEAKRPHVVGRTLQPAAADQPHGLPQAPPLGGISNRITRGFFHLLRKSLKLDGLPAIASPLPGSGTSERKPVMLASERAHEDES